MCIQYGMASRVGLDGVEALNKQRELLLSSGHTEQTDVMSFDDGHDLHTTYLR